MDTEVHDAALVTSTEGSQGAHVGQGDTTQDSQPPQEGEQDEEQQVVQELVVAGGGILPQGDATILTDTAYLVKWAEQHHIDKELSILLDAGFDTVEVLARVDKDDLDMLGIKQPGVRKKILLACYDLAERLPTLASKPSPIPLTAPIPYTSPPPLTTNPNAPLIITPTMTTRIPKKRAPRRCRNCHHFYVPNKHTCTGPCTSWETCPTGYVRGHNDVMKLQKEEQKQQKKTERAKKRYEKDYEKQSSKKRMQIRSLLFKLDPLPNAEEYITQKVAKVLESNPAADPMEARRQASKEWEMMSLRHKDAKDKRRRLREAPELLDMVIDRVLEREEEEFLVSDEGTAAAALASPPIAVADITSPRSLKRGRDEIEGGGLEDERESKRIRYASERDLHRIIENVLEDL